MSATDLDLNGRMVRAATQGATVADGLQEGGRVEVRRRFDAEWARGFEVAEVTDDGIRVRRLSDGEILPVLFDPDDIRAERRGNNMWWM